jgi:hypothetical protein
MLEHEEYEHQYNNNDMDEDNFEYMGNKEEADDTDFTFGTVGPRHALLRQILDSIFFTMEIAYYYCENVEVTPDAKTPIRELFWRSGNNCK